MFPQPSTPLFNLLFKSRLPFPFHSLIIPSKFVSSPVPPPSFSVSVCFLSFSEFLFWDSSIMASETETPDFSSVFDELLRDGDLSVVLPLILEEMQQAGSRRIFLLNPAMRSMMMVLEGDSLLAVMGSKNGQPPASKASIDAMPSIDVSEIEGEDGDCVICLENWGAGGSDVVVKEMPCKHRFHSNCIEKWLRVHGSCPVCRYQMPVEVRKRDREGGEEEGGERRGVLEIWINIAFNSSRSTRDDNQTSSSDDTASPTPDHEIDG